MSQFKRKWQALEERVKLKRHVNKKKEKGNTKKVDHEFITVQRLSADVIGKAQKFGRMGPRQYVDYPHTDLTVEKLKNACLNHFHGELHTNNMSYNCDILAGEQGPSCHTLEQIPSMKLIHVRFMPTEDFEIKSLSSRRNNLQSTASLNDDSVKFTACASTDSTNKYSHPKSISVTQMLKLGKKVTSSATVKNVEIFIFEISDMSWRQKIKAVFEVSSHSFARGGFREVFKARWRCENKLDNDFFQNKYWVLKKYLPETLEVIKELEQSLEEYTRKNVQMHVLAQNLTERCHARIEELGVQSIFGNWFRYNKVALGKCDNDSNTTEEWTTIEEYVEGSFSKYINNDGTICFIDNDITKKAECLAHYTYEKSNFKIMLLDIQGSDYVLYDPEIASAELKADNEYLFCAGNLSHVAITTFTKYHKCNKYCKAIQLTKLSFVN